MEYPIDPAEIQRLAQSPAGQELLALLQRSGGQNLQNAMQRASAGDYSEAKSALSGLVSSPEVQRLLRQLEGQR